MRKSGISRGKGFGPRKARMARAAMNRSAEKTRQAAGKAKPRKPLVSRPKPVTAEEKRARKLVGLRSGGMCEGCGQRPATDWAHRVRREVGPWCPSNGLHLCSDLSTPDGRRGCHEQAHSRPTRFRSERGWILLTTDNPLTFPAWLHGRGWVLLDPDGGWVAAGPPSDPTPTERSAA